MLTALTVYFWVLVILSLISWAHALFQPLAYKPSEEKNKLTGIENVVIKFLATLLTVPLILALAVPLYYLQWTAFNALGFPVWVIYLSIAVNFVGMYAYAWKPGKLVGYPAQLGILGFFIAWYGLQVLSKAQG